MTWSAETIIYTVFIPLYAVLLVANVYNCYKHGATRVFGYVFLVFVSVCMFPIFTAHI